MMGSGSQGQREASEYDAIEAAMAETARGRRFLAEHARRHRGADTETLLQAIGRLEGVVTRESAVLAPPEVFRETVAALAESIAGARADIAAMTLPEGHEGHPATETLDTLVRGSERATSAVLAAAEAMQEAAWSLRERGGDTGLCDVLDRRAIAIYTACSVQDVSAQRTGRAVAALREVEARIAGLLGRAVSPAAEPAREAAAARPPLPEPMPDADAIAFAPAAEPPPAGPQPRPPVADAADDLALAFADLDALSIEEKIALFS